MEALFWIGGLILAAGFVWLFVTALKREMAKPDRPVGWGDTTNSRYDDAFDNDIGDRD